MHPNPGAYLGGFPGFWKPQKFGKTTIAHLYKIYEVMK